VPEVWIVDLRRDRILVYRDPSPSGYRMTSIVERRESLAPAAFADLVVAADDILS